MFGYKVKSFDKITAGIQKVVDELEHHGKLHADTATNKADVAARLDDEADEHMRESTKHFHAAGKLRALLG